MSYGGLRGAVAFALVLIIDKNMIPSKDMMVTTTIAVVYFTVFVQGMTIKFFVRILKVPQQSDKTLTMNERLHSTLIDHVMGGIEEVADQFLGNYKIRDRFKYFNNKYLRRFLTNNSQIQEPKIFETHSKLNLIDAMKMVNNGSKLTLDPGASISTLLKSYTSANLSQQPKDEENGVVNQSPLMNLDIGELSYNPSFKDLNDSQIHHILDDAMFKPSNRRARRYSHSQFYDNEPKHPPFHHKMRWQIRELSFNWIYFTAPNHPEVTVTSPGDYDNDEGGITFSVDSTRPIEELEEPVERTLTETILPWKRGNDVNNTYPAKPQEEFPTWVENRDHYPGYMSPTLTYLESIRDSQPSASKFNTYCIDEEEFGSEDEVFGDHEEENENRVEPEESQPGCSKDFEQRSLDEIEEDIIKEVMEGAQKKNAKTYQEEEIMKEAQKRKADTTREERRRFFRNSATRSPDRISMMSINSEDFARPISDLSIECPDVVVDLEDKDGCKNTKL
ncbi:hypothetical protein CEXT_301381 [Caerostris extrusa]|uniref:Cation/H+ exchanger transmembrane domain-containing protein n=1 Tax=Caerostris extrusa TaxID=172846 RepID=A0AAV4R7N0_CAEEX|nr:hypothetical protein CEXT_301381 [Caerostris extrusa]